MPLGPRAASTSHENSSVAAPYELAIICALVVLGFVTILSAYWPGVMIDDARWQYQQSVDNAYEDWHPPLMAWIWRRFMFLQPGPGPMLLLQASLYWLGIGLVALWLYRRGNPRLGIAAALAGFVPAPLALMGSVTKDCLMAGTLCSALGLMLWSNSAAPGTKRLLLGAAALAALLLAAALRVNAFLACVPLALAVLPKAFTSTVSRLALCTVAWAAIFFLAPGVVARAVDAEDTDAQLSLIIFDLGGITEHTGVSQFPDLHVANPVAVNHRCYDPYEWDSYSTWAKVPCPLGFAAFQALVDQGDIDPREVWLNAIAGHPLAYAEHRLTHFNLSIWFLVQDNPIPTAWTQSVDNPWNFHVRSNALLRSLDGIATGAALTPLGWPVFWLAAALAVLIVSWWSKLDRTVAAVAASAFVYGTGYLIVGVATGMRYYLWVITGAALAAILAARELTARQQEMDRQSLLLSATVIVLPTAMAVATRVSL